MIKITGLEITVLPNGRFRLYYDDASDGRSFFVSESGFGTRQEAMEWATRNLEMIPAATTC